MEEEEEYESDSESEQEQSEGKKKTNFFVYHNFYLISFNCFLQLLKSVVRDEREKALPSAKKMSIYTPGSTRNFGPLYFGWEPFTAFSFSNRRQF